ncbi:hypothetical protein BCR39DRAFT_125853 [Naematelia encephala]|uniref:Uncharacterized protein n=1 Tax=Naematelia encephala TaxID=71784 RepID=A0A1Y2BIY8_9TREE|nr:hypothetical protein BCR39DRAFT_125853 [Naematelia encephala]
MSSYRADALFSVKGKTVIVTGGGSGIGKGMAAALAINGAKVIICGRRVEPIEETAAELNAAAKESSSGGQVIAIQADVSTKHGITDFYNKCEHIIDKLDYLVNNAGFSSNWKDQSPITDPLTLAKKLFSIDDVDFANMTAIHVAGPYLLGVKFIPLFQKSADPSICNITSIASVFLNRAVCEFSYAQSKAAEAHMTTLMAAALQPFKIRVNSVCPGLFPSGLTTTSDGKLYSLLVGQLKNIPKGREGLVEEMAGPVMMLATPAGGYINGANLVIDGGWVLNSSANDV